MWTSIVTVKYRYFQAKKGSRSRTRTCMFNGSSCGTGVSAEPLIETGSCNPALSVWHGEEDVATFSTDAGIYKNDALTNGLENIFDNDSSTYYNSHDDYRGVHKTITINFQVSFTSLFPNFWISHHIFALRSKYLFTNWELKKEIVRNITMPLGALISIWIFAWYWTLKTPMHCAQDRIRSEIEKIIDVDKLRSNIYIIWFIINELNREHITNLDSENSSWIPIWLKPLTVKAWRLNTIQIIDYPPWCSNVNPSPRYKERLVDWPFQPEFHRMGEI